MHPFALFDDRGPVGPSVQPTPSSRLYTGFVREHRCVDPATLDAIWAAVEIDQAEGLHAVVLGDYEWGAKLLGAGLATAQPDRAEALSTAALRVLMFQACQRMTRVQADAWLAEQASAEDDPHAGVMHLQPSVDRAAFTQAIDRIHAAIAAGETYQVNYTYRLHGQAWGTPLALYRRLRERQPVAYGAFIGLPPGEAVTHVLSCSPELFVRSEGGVVTAKPMKGTASRFNAPEGDSETARLLSLDVKNRAENLMIVDLLRNDLGRIAQIGTVRVPELFAIEPYTTVFQMTSTVQARLRPSVRMPELLRAVFPCGSITGAPKHHTMDLIADIESTPRGLYCGAIGWVDAPVDAPADLPREGPRLGDFCFSVAIRTLVLGPARAGLRPVRLGVGAGIVKDSRADDEFDECRLKARFLTGLDPGFELFETVLATPAGGLPYLERHLERLAHSAAALGFALDAQAARALLVQAATPGVDVADPQRLRLALAHGGRLTLTAAALPPLPDGPLMLRLAEQRLPEHNPLAAYKITRRAAYDEGVRVAERHGAFDSLFFSTGGWLVEGGRTTVLLRLDGRWFTPAVADGALPGVMRSVVMADAAWAVAERRLTRDDLQRAEGLAVCNALRGVRMAQVVQHAGACF